MAAVGITEGEKLSILLGNGATPEVFAHPALINTTRGVTFTSNVSEAEVPDAADPAAPAYMARRVKSTDFTISGAGKCDRASVTTFMDWWMSGEPKNIKVHQGETGEPGAFTHSGPAILKDFSLTGERGDYQEFTCAIVPAGAFTYALND